jgi:YD repeat-containing protein
MQKAPLQENPLDGSPTRWTRPWHLWLENIARSFSFIGLSDVPSSYTGQAGKVVKVNATEDGLEFGTGGGGVTDHTLLTNIGTSTHPQLDSERSSSISHRADTTIHFTQAQIDHVNILNKGTNTHSQIDSHIGDASIHFTEASISHTDIQNIGTNTHAQIDSHIADAGLHNLVFDQGAHTYTDGKETGEVISLSASPLKTLVKTYNASGNVATVTDGVSTWTFSYNGAGFLTGSVKT